MFIDKVRIKNFRCLEDVEVDFGEITTFVGPNGAGKSTVLRALEWFFNGERNDLKDSDVFSGATEDREIRVAVTFRDLSAKDREVLTDLYAPAGATTFTATRTWLDGEVKTTGMGKMYAGFEHIRKETGKVQKKKLYTDYAAANPGFGLAAVSKGDEVEAALRVWESNNIALLVDTPNEEAGHLFGFNGKNKMSNLFDFVFVTADLRASEQSIEGQKTVLGRILERSLDRVGADEALEELTNKYSAEQADINKKYFDDQLKVLGTALTAEVEAFTLGRRIQLTAKSPDLTPSKTKIELAIADNLTETSIDRQGHGFQRALLISALKLLAEGGRTEESGSVITLAIEEPELFQHPTQARVFAEVLRSLAEDSGKGIQVTYATHNPIFINAQHFDEVRRVSRKSASPVDHPEVRVTRASQVEIEQKVDTFCQTTALRSKWEQVCTVNLAEAIFAEAVVLVEGDTDREVINGYSKRADQRSLARDGISVAEVHGKENFYVPHAILTTLGIPCIVVFDNDRGGPDRVRINKRTKPNVEDLVRDAETKNRVAHHKILRYFGLPENDMPSGKQSDVLYAFEDTLETVLAEEWTGWQETVDAVVDSGRGVAAKNAATYGLAAKASDADCGPSLTEVMKMARALV